MHKMDNTLFSALACFLLLPLLPLFAQDMPAPPRARSLGIPFDGLPGPHNAITDVPGVKVGYTTLIEGEGRLEVGKGPVRSGVTVVLPTDSFSNYRSFPAAVFSLNGMGEMTAGLYLQDYPLLYGPIGITNTNSVGVVRDAIGKWLFDNYSAGGLFDFSFGLPVAAETWDGALNDINGLHIRVVATLTEVRPKTDQDRLSSSSMFSVQPQTVAAQATARLKCRKL